MTSAIESEWKDTYTAHHEAGHAVIGRVLGVMVGSVTIVPDALGRGNVNIKSPQATLDEWDARGQLEVRR